MNEIELISFSDTPSNYQLLNKWCSDKNVYEWFEQRVLSYGEIKEKYQRKLLEGKQKLFMVYYQTKPIGFVQIYQYDDIIFDEIKEYKNIYEFDLFIGEVDYLSKGLGSKIVDYVDKYIYDYYHADCILLRPFKRNTRAIRCYQKNNYQIIKEYDSHDTLGNKEIISVMIKRR